MPVTTRGKKIVEKGTGRVVGRGKTRSSAKKSARIRNWAHAEKKRGRKLVKGKGGRLRAAPRRR